MHTPDKIKRALIAANIAFCALSTQAQAMGNQISDFMELSLEDLLSIEISSVNFKSEKQLNVASSTFILTSEDIRQSGMTSLPELFRLIPGFNVARLDSNKWAVSSRGFNGIKSNKLQVLVDGRSVYTPLFSGVYWESLNIPLSNIERIEAIKGPGATMWGSNAVNGVVNIITRKADDSPRDTLELIAGDGDIEKQVLYRAVRKVDNIALRAHASFSDYANTDDYLGSSTRDEWSKREFGLRSDIELNATDRITLNADYSKGHLQQITMGASAFNQDVIPNEHRATFETGSFMANWQRTNNYNGMQNLKFYYDHFNRDEWGLIKKIDLYNIDYKQRVQLNNNFDILFGAGYRGWKDDLTRSYYSISFDPEDSERETWSSFVQLEYEPVDSVNIQIGTKYEHTRIIESSFQPGMRVAWSFRENQNLWFAASRALRTPSRADQDITIRYFSFDAPFYPDPSGALVPVPGGRVVLQLAGDRDLDPEEANVFELGYKATLSNRASLDISAFYTEYDKIIIAGGEPVVEVSGSPVPDHIDVTTPFTNDGKAYSSGLEAVFSYQFTDSLRSVASYSRLHTHISARADAIGAGLEHNAPEHAARLTVTYQATNNLSLNTSVFYVDELTVTNNTGQQTTIPSYTRTDLNILWQARHNLSLSLSGQNLFDGSHPEFATNSNVASEMPRAAQLKLTWTR